MVDNETHQSESHEGSKIWTELKRKMVKHQYWRRNSMHMPQFGCVRVCVCVLKRVGFHSELEGNRQRPEVFHGLPIAYRQCDGMEKMTLFLSVCSFIQCC